MALIRIVGLPGQHQRRESVDVFGARVEVGDEVAHRCEPRIGAIAPVVHPEVVDGAEPDQIGQYVVVAERQRTQPRGIGQIDQLVARRNCGVSLVEPRARPRDGRGQR
jgi:hypothetical protein